MAALRTLPTLPRSRTRELSSPDAAVLERRVDSRGLAPGPARVRNMLISDTHRFIFVHIPRTGGTSVKNALAPVSIKRRYARWEKWLSRLGLIRNYRHYRFRTHSALAEIQRRLPVETFDRYFKFAIVRHPWSRLESEYRFLLRGSHLHDNRRRHRHRWIEHIDSFEEFVFERIHHPNAFQYDMVSSTKGEVGVDFVGHTEFLQRDFRVICNRIGLPARLARFNTSHRASGALTLSAGLPATALREFFLQHWQRDLDAFGYSEPFPE